MFIKYGLEKILIYIISLKFDIYYVVSNSKYCSLSQYLFKYTNSNQSSFILNFHSISDTIEIIHNTKISDNKIFKLYELKELEKEIFNFDKQKYRINKLKKICEL